MIHLTKIHDIEQTLTGNRLCLFYIKAPDCGVCNVMLDKVARLADIHPTLCSFYTNITEEPLIAGPCLFRTNCLVDVRWERSISIIRVHQSG